MALHIYCGTAPGDYPTEQVNPNQSIAIHPQDLVWQRSQFEAFGRTKDEHVSLWTKRRFLRFDRVFDWDFVPFNEASDKFMNRLVPGLMPSKVEDQVHNWNATRPKGLGTGSDSEPLSVQRIGVVKEPARLPFWYATWFTKLTNVLALSSLRQLVAHRQMHHVKLLIDKRFYSSKEANMVGGRPVLEGPPPEEEEVEFTSGLEGRKKSSKFGIGSFLQDQMFV